MPEDADEGPSKAELEAKQLLREGEALSRSRDHVAALERFNKAIALDPSNSMAWYNRGVLLEGQRDAKGAKQSFTICLDLEPNHAPATANLAVLLERMGDVEGAEAMAIRALTHYPDHPELMDIRRRCTSDRPQTPDLPAERPTTSATWDDEQLTRAMRKAGVDDTQAVLEESSHHDVDGDGNLDEEELEAAVSVVAAQQQVQQSIEESTEQAASELTETTEVEDDLPSIIQRAEEELAAGHPKQAVAMLKPHLRAAASKDAHAWRVAALGMHRLNLEDHALQAASHAKRLDPDNPSVHALLGDISASKGDRETAKASFERALELGAGEEVAVRRWSVLDRTAHPEEWFGEAMERLSIDAPSADRHALATWLIGLGEGEATALERLANQPRTIPEGPALAEQSLALLGDDLPRLRARAHSLRLEHLEAISLWKQEVTAQPDDASAWTGMARALEAAGELEKAARCHAKASGLSGEALMTTLPASSEDEQPNEAEASRSDLSVEDEAPSLLQLDPVVEEQQEEELSTPSDTAAAADLLLAPLPQVESTRSVSSTAPATSIDLVAAALDVESNMSAPVRETTPEQERAQGREWFNRGTDLLEGKKYREALNCFDKALSLLADDEDKVILVLNARGNCFYYMEDYPKCVEAYHQAMLIRPAQVRGQTLYNMGVAYAEMERYLDAIKCFEQAEPRGLAQQEMDLAKEQIRRCKILQKELERRKKGRR